MNKLILGDNIEIMKKIPSDSIDLIFADPPYNMTLEKPLFRPNGDIFDGVNDEWDKFSSLKEYDDECKIWIKECLRILKKNGSFWVIGSFQNIHRLGYIIQNLGEWIINEIVWEKTNPVPNFAGTRFVNAQETMLWFTKNKKSKFTFNYKTMKYINGGKQMKSIWNFSTANGKERLRDKYGKKVHSTQKPLALLERIIISSSNYGDVILDPFSGTGTTGHAAKLLGRKYICIEKNEKYFKASEKRLKNVIEVDRLDLKLALYDLKPEKVNFIDLIKYKFIKIENEIFIKDIKLYFNQDGTIKYKNENISPNQLCKIIFKKPTNAWEHLFYKDKKISHYRELFRDREKEVNNDDKEVIKCRKCKVERILISEKLCQECHTKRRDKRRIVAKKYYSKPEVKLLKSAYYKEFNNLNHEFVIERNREYYKNTKIKISLQVKKTKEQEEKKGFE